MSATTECKKWWMPEDFWLPLCSNRFEPEEGLASCPICVGPIDPATFSGSGSGDPIPADPPPEELP